MGNANGREEEDESLSLTETGRSNGGEMGLSYNHAQVPGRVASSESMGNIDNNNNNNTPPHSPGRSPSPLLFAPQVSFSLLFFLFPFYFGYQNQLSSFITILRLSLLHLFILD